MNIDKFGRMDWHFNTKSGLGRRDDIFVSEATLDVKTRTIKNVVSPTEPTDAANKRYVDATVLQSNDEKSKVNVEERIEAFQREYVDLNNRINHIGENISEIVGKLQNNFVKYEDLHQLVKDEFLIEKSKLIGCLRDLIAGKIKRPSNLENKDVSKIDKTELEVVLVEWRGKLLKKEF